MKKVLNKLISNKNLENSKQAFSGLTKNYQEMRPNYPNEIYNEIISFWSVGQDQEIEQPVVVDVGCGTGISTRAMYKAFRGNCDMYGIEPGREMRETASNITKEKITYLDASAEKLPFEENSVDIITVAQALQWFDRRAFYNEALRILKKNGVLAVYENNRDWEHCNFLEEHEIFLEKFAYKKDGGKYSRYYRNFPYDIELKEKFDNLIQKEIHWDREMLPEDFVTLAKSSTQVKRAIDNIGEKEAVNLIMNNVMAHLNTDKKIDIVYNTKLYMARKI